ncbi:MAG: hypothetical protein ACI9R3_006223 [Verrucomicrobiales bacterium]|jgi:hypothetical protein
MTIIERIRSLGNSPTHERDVATMFNPLRLSVWLLFLNATLMVAIGGGFYILSQTSRAPYEGRSLIGVLQVMGFSEILTSVIFLSLSAFITIFVPIRVVGPIMGPRVGRYFDQIVLSGISPVRYFAGKVLSQNVFLAVIAVAAMPYLALCVSLGGISINYTLLGVLVLAVYANVLALSTLLLSVFISEITSIIVILLLSVITFVIGLAPMVPNPMPVSPSAVFLAPLYENVGSVGWNRLFTIPWIPQEHVQMMIFLSTAGAVCFMCITWLVLGPLHCIIQENGTFGEVVLKGDSKKRGFLKRRMALRLRSEISFFYENRAPWLRRWDFPLRWAMSEVLFGLSLAIPFAILPILVSAEFNDEKMVITAFFVGVLWILWNNALFLKDRTTERLKQGGAEVGHIDLLFYFANLVMIAACVSLFLMRAGNLMDQQWILSSSWQTAQGGTTGAPPVWRLPGGSVALSLLVFGFELHWFARWVSIRLWSRWSALALSFAIFTAVAVFIPLAPFLTMKASNLQHMVAGLESVTPVVAILSFLTAICHCINDYPYRDLGSLGIQGFHAMLAFHFSVGLLWMLAFFRNRKKLPIRELH